MRIGWSESQTYDEAIFTRDGNHPDDGASVGTIAGVFPPVQPTLPAIPDVAANEKYLTYLGWGNPRQHSATDFLRLPGSRYVKLRRPKLTLHNRRHYGGEQTYPCLRALVAYAFSATVVGVLIASRTYVDEAIAAIPASTGGGFPTTSDVDSQRHDDVHQRRSDALRSVLA